MAHEPLDPKKLHELASRPGTFPEMIQATYQAGMDEGLGEADKASYAARRYQRHAVWLASFLVLFSLACLGYCSF